MIYNQYEDIINNLASKHRTNKPLVISCIDHVFKEIRNKIGDDEYPNILIHNLGRFKPNLRYMIYKIRNTFKYAQDNNVRIEYYQRLNRYLKAYKRICKEEKIEFKEEFIEIEKVINNKLNIKVSEESN